MLSRLKASVRVCIALGAVAFGAGCATDGTSGGMYGELPSDGLGSGSSWSSDSLGPPPKQKKDIAPRTMQAPRPMPMPRAPAGRQ